MHTPKHTKLNKILRMYIHVHTYVLVHTVGVLVLMAIFYIYFFKFKKKFFFVFDQTAIIGWSAIFEIARKHDIEERKAKYWML